MPKIEDNVSTWNSPSSWAGRGEEWSGPWGGSEPQWFGSLMPRLHAFVPTGTILEIGPGYGRWTRYLKGLCDALILVDLAERCIEACRQRFAADRHISYHVGDGRSLAQIQDHSVDLAFSFDSLVHAEADVLDAYARELARTLKPDGIGFIHHSNMGSLRHRAALARRVPERLRGPLTRRGLLVNVYAWRAETATAEGFASSCAEAGLACVGQEKISWYFGPHLIDTISVVTPHGSRWDRPNVVLKNPGFVEEARAIARLAPLYCTTSSPPAVAGAMSGDHPATSRSSFT